MTAPRDANAGRLPGLDDDAWAALQIAESVSPVKALVDVFDRVARADANKQAARASLERMQKTVPDVLRSARAISTFLGPTRGLDTEFMACRRLPLLVEELQQCMDSALLELGSGVSNGGRPANTKAFAVASNLRNALEPTHTPRELTSIICKVMEAMDFTPAQVNTALDNVRKVRKRDTASR